MFHIHKWEIVSAAQQKVYLSTWFVTENQLPSKLFTDIALRCKVCGNLKTKRIEGLHELDDLRSENK